MDAKEILTKGLPEYLPEFIEALKDQVTLDNERWGDTWKERGLVWNNQSQEERFVNWVIVKWTEHSKEGKPFPWLKVAGEAFIGFIREKYLPKAG